MREDHEFFITVGNRAEAEIFEKNSRFIGHISPVKDEYSALEFIKEIKKKYYDATHNVYAYTLENGNHTRFSDDGEPKGTAGLPVLEVIKKSGLTRVAIVVTRYFGGTLLGAGGLVRAYGRTAETAIEAAGMVKFEKFEVTELFCSYSNYQKYSAIFPEYGIITDSTDFAENVKMVLAVKQENASAFLQRITEIGNGKDFLKKVGERFDVP